MAFAGDNEKLPFKYTTVGRIIEFFRLLYISTAHNARGSSRNAFLAILTRVMTMVLMGATFYILMSITGLRNMTGRTDFILFLMSGIFLFLIHIRTFRQNIGIFEPNSPMSVHAPITPLLSLFSNGASQLYINIISILIIGTAFIFWSPQLKSIT